MGTMMDPSGTDEQSTQEHGAEAVAEASRPLAHALRRHLLVPALAGLVAGGVMSQIAEPRYQAQARLWADSRSFAGRDSVQVLTSRDFARQVVETRNLAARLSAPLGGFANAVSGAALRVAGFAGAAAELSLGSRDTLALRSVERGLSVREAGGGQIAIDFASPDPKLSADVANAFAQNYLELRQSRPFSMEPKAPPAAEPTARIVASAAPAAAPRWPTPIISSLAAGIGTFLLALGFQTLARRRARAAGSESGAVPLPEMARAGAQHLPWIGATSEEHVDEQGVALFRRASRERDLADLSRLIELRGTDARLVVVTGPSADEGIGRCAVALGRSLAAHAERRAVIVCLDVAAPALDGLTADPRAPGLTDLLFGVASFSDAIHREISSRCHVIPPGRGAREADGLVAADRLPLILTALKQTYDHVVVAAPPLGATEGAGRIAALGPTTILVTQPGGLATDAVQAFDALAAQGFGDIAMVTFAPEVAGALPHAA
ncbi:lipopolysaccharide biosynthesis protein [Ancylobacter novellus DSM 506]|uniref:Lipopolysaccharide biosynthesis protein n=1 Tax=Ancylobacter novellus (strain ATCC 8093 / DSM 506 / JCM 20403 / CCM 1077 / IAM 12100 / NBRC 12443 / NCIMB 10456) TaxID=639283 RepID=D7AAH4_ANCN5|nr:lipopolysaccharide biosynthesis protein [Ancylobacter novellus]ADH88977.1 lipopolysaccharide biosynthesis protein [Ancylobacter novellus DSM 506]